MPIVYRGADLFASGCEALVNPVNCAGAMGRGLALAFKRRDPARLDDVARSVRALAETLIERRIASVAATGCRIVLLAPGPRGRGPGRTGRRSEARAVGKPARREEGESMNAPVNPSTIRMAPRYVVRTVDEDWIDLFDAPSRLDAKRAAWEEAKRRVREHPACTTVVIDRRTGVTLWRSDPDVAPRYQVLAVDATVFYALETDLPLPGDVLSSHKAKDDAWTAFYAAIEERVGNDIVVLCDATHVQSILASSDDDAYDTGAA